MIGNLYLPSWVLNCGKDGSIAVSFSGQTRMSRGAKSSHGYNAPGCGRVLVVCHNGGTGGTPRAHNRQTNKRLYIYTRYTRMVFSRNPVHHFEMLSRSTRDTTSLLEICDIEDECVLITISLDPQEEINRLRHDVTELLMVKLNLYGFNWTTDLTNPF